MFFAATVDSFYTLDTTDGDWDDVTAALSLGLGTDESWVFTQFGNRVIATNVTDGPHYFDIGSSSAFAALSGSPPAARAMASVGDFLVLGGISSDNKQVRWSGINDTEHWTVRHKLSDMQTFPDGDRIMAVVGFERGGLVFQRNAVREMIPAYDTPLVFRFQKTEESRGCVAPGAVMGTGRDVFYLADDGFYAYGQPSRPIGAHRVNGFFVEDSKAKLIKDVQGAIDPVSHTVWWRYSSTANTSSTTTDKMLGYNWDLDRWTLVEVDVAFLFPSLVAGYTLDQLDTVSADLDALGFSLDSDAWKGGAPLLGAFDADYKMGFFGGQPMEAVLQTGDVHIATMLGLNDAQDRRAFVRGFQPISDASTVTGRIAAKTRAGATRAWDASQSVNTTTGVIPTRNDGLFHRFEITIAADQDWSYVHGVQPDVRLSGTR